MSDESLELGTFEMPAETRRIRELIAERDALKAELAEARQANELYCEDQQAKHDQLTELREAAEAYRRDERNYARLDAVLDKLAKVKP